MSDEVLEGTATDLPPEEPTKEPINAVIVVKTVDENGAISTDVVVNGNVQATEAQTLLELGLKAWRVKIGLAKE